MRKAIMKDMKQNVEPAEKAYAVVWNPTLVP
jgi:hypothetical protein